MNGLFITFEGGEGAGKSTQISLLQQKFMDMGISVVTTREPGGTFISEKIRNIIIDKEHTEMSFMTETLLYAASRAQHVEEVIRPALEKGHIVLCDRFLDSSLAYQGFARGLGIETIEEVNRFATGGLSPDITILFDVSPQKGMERKANFVSLDRMETEKMDFHQRVYDGYLKLATMYPQRIQTIDATETREQVQQTIWNLLEPHLTKVKRN